MFYAPFSCNDPLDMGEAVFGIYVFPLCLSILHSYSPNRGQLWAAISYKKVYLRLMLRWIVYRCNDKHSELFTMSD